MKKDKRNKERKRKIEREVREKERRFFSMDPLSFQTIDHDLEERSIGFGDRTIFATRTCPSYIYITIHRVSSNTHNCKYLLNLLHSFSRTIVRKKK